MKKWLLLVGAILTEVTGSLSLKAAIETPALYAVVVVGYLAAFALLSVALRHGLPLGVGYGVWRASGVALTAIFSSIIFHESLSPLMIIGIGVVMAGVLLVQVGSHSVHNPNEELSR